MNVINTGKPAMATHMDWNIYKFTIYIKDIVYSVLGARYAYVVS